MNFCDDTHSPYLKRTAISVQFFLPLLEDFTFPRAFSLLSITDSLRYQYGINTDLVRIESVMPPYCTRNASKGEIAKFE